MIYSTLTGKGQTTIPSSVRDALHIKEGDRLFYHVEGDHALLWVHPGTAALKGALASGKGKDLSFAQIRKAAAEAAQSSDEK